MEKKKYYYARYKCYDDDNDMFYIFDTNETIYVQKNNINLLGKKLKDNDLVCIKKEKDSNGYNFVTIMDVLDNNIAWSEHYIYRNRQEYEIHSKDQKDQMDKYNQRFSNKKLTLIYHTIKHPICDDISKRKKWESMGINYSSEFLLIKSKYDDISRNLVIDNIHSQWVYNHDHFSLNFIDSNGLLVSLKLKSDKPKFKITTLHYGSLPSIKEKGINYFSLFTFDNLSYYVYDFKNIISQMKRKKTRYFRNNPGDFYSSVMYDFDEVIYGLACLKYCYRYRNRIEGFIFDEGDYNRYLENYLEFVLDSVEENKIHEFKRELFEFINYDIDNMR